MIYMIKNLRDIYVGRIWGDLKKGNGVDAFIFHCINNQKLFRIKKYLQLKINYLLVLLFCHFCFYLGSIFFQMSYFDYLTLPCVSRLTREAHRSLGSSEIC